MSSSSGQTEKPSEPAALSSTFSAVDTDPFDVTWRERVVVLGTLGILIGMAWAIGMRLAPEKTLELTGAVPASFFALGKFLPLWGITGQSHFGPYQLGLVIGVMDTCSALLIIYALEGFYRIRPLKRALERVQTNAHLVLVAYPAMKRAAVGGIILFVLFPIAGTGAIGGTFIGILLGMQRFVLIGCISVGGFLGGLTMAFVADNFGAALERFQEMQSDPVIKYGIIAGVAVVLLFLLWLANRAYKRALETARARTEGSGVMEPAPGLDSAEQ